MVIDDPRTALREVPTPLMILEHQYGVSPRAGARARARARIMRTRIVTRAHARGREWGRSNSDHSGETSPWDGSSWLNGLISHMAVHSMKSGSEQEAPRHGLIRSELVLVDPGVATAWSSTELSTLRHY